MTPRSAAERGPRTAAGRALVEIAGTEGQPTGVIRDAILAIEAEAGATAAVPLDVERLARALRSLIEGPDWKGQSTIGEYAAEIAAAYARLASAVDEGRDAVNWLGDAIREGEELRERVIGPRPAVGCRWPVEDCYCPPPYENCAYERKVGHKEPKVQP